MKTPNAAASGSFTIGGDLRVVRLGFGAMRITGPGIWGPPADRGEAVRTLQRVPDLGIDFIDTADSYGPFVSEDLIAEALHPYPHGLVIATKGGLTRTGPEEWHPVGRPEYLTQCLEMSLRRLRLDCIDLYQFHEIDAQVPLEESIGTLAVLQAQARSVTSASRTSTSTIWPAPGGWRGWCPCRTGTTSSTAAATMCSPCAKPTVWGSSPGHRWTTVGSADPVGGSTPPRHATASPCHS